MNDGDRTLSSDIDAAILSDYFDFREIEGANARR
jgi:hypothetical protein